MWYIINALFTACNLSHSLHFQLFFFHVSLPGIEWKLLTKPNFRLRLLHQQEKCLKRWLNYQTWMKLCQWIQKPKYYYVNRISHGVAEIQTCYNYYSWGYKSSLFDVSPRENSDEVNIFLSQFLFALQWWFLLFLW